ncbi:ABC transporter permease [Pyrococcus abyssi]|nr:ABC transporter permease [Pyrococcus abyssi]
MTIAVKEFEVNIRTKRFYGTIAFFLILAVIFIRLFNSVLPSHIYITPFQGILFGSFQTPLVYAITLVSILLGATAINSEINKGTIKVLYSKPIYRDTIIFGKLLGGTITIAFILGILWVVMIGIALISGVPVSGYDVSRLLVLYMFSVLYGAALYALGMLLSTLIRSQTNSMLAGVFIFLLFAFIIPGILAPILALAFAGTPPTITYTPNASETSMFQSREMMEWMDRYVAVYMKITSTSILYHYENLMRMVFGIKQTEDIVGQLSALLVSNDTSTWKISEERPIIEGIAMSLNNIVVITVFLVVSLALSYYKFVRMDLR